jgi:hypothetical protein
MAVAAWAAARWLVCIVGAGNVDGDWFKDETAVLTVSAEVDKPSAMPAAVGAMPGDSSSFLADSLQSSSSSEGRVGGAARMTGAEGALGSQWHLGIPQGLSCNGRHH